MFILDLNERQRRMLLPAATVLLAVLYALVLRPLARKASELDAPLESDWRRLAIALGRSNATQLDFAAFAGNLRDTRTALDVLRAAARRATARIAIPERLRDHLDMPFQLVDYQYEQHRLADEIEAAAKALKVQLADGVLAGFPEHTADLQQPELLWAGLEFAQHAVRAALSNQVTAIHSLRVPSGFASQPATNGDLSLVEVPVEMELSGPAPGVTRFLELLPLRAGETQAAGLPDLGPDKPVLFIDRLLLRRENPEQADQVHVWVRLIGFLPRP